MVDSFGIDISNIKDNSLDERIQAMLDKAVELGANPRDRVCGTLSTIEYVATLNARQWHFIGIGHDKNTWFSNICEAYAKIITLEQAEQMLGITQETKMEEKDDISKALELVEIVARGGAVAYKNSKFCTAGPANCIARAADRVLSAVIHGVGKYRVKTKQQLEHERAQEQEKQAEIKRIKQEISDLTEILNKLEANDQNK